MKILTTIILTLFVAGCSTFKPKPSPIEPVVVERRVATVKVFHPPLPDGGNFKQVEWKVLTPEIMQEYLTSYEAGEAPTMVLYGLTPRNYENLAGNMAELKRLLKGYRGIILYYRENVNEMAEPNTPSDK